MEERLKNLEETVAQMADFINRLGDINTIPYEIGNALASRMVSTSSKSASTETQGVNESASNQYSVAKPMDGFLTVNVGGTIRNIPYYD